MTERFKVIFSKRASVNLEAIFDYISLNSPQNASALTTELVDAIDSLEWLPHRYPVVQTNRRANVQTRAMPVRSFLIYYRVLDPQKRFASSRFGMRRADDRVA